MLSIASSARKDETFRFKVDTQELFYPYPMPSHEIRVAAVIVAAASLSLSACKRSDSAASAQPVTAAIVQPAPQPAQSPPAQAPPSASLNTAAPSLPPVLDAASNAGVPASVSTADSTESFTIAGHTFRVLKHVQRTAHDETVEWWELRNSKDQVVYRETYPVNVVNGEFESEMSVTVTPFTTKEGAGIVVQRGEEPSDPMSGGSVQVFGYKYGQEKYGLDESLFQSFGPPISLEGKYLGVDAETPRPEPTLPPAITRMTMDDILKFKIWTGNFFVMYPVRINWITGSLEPALRCVEATSKGRSGPCSFPVEVEAHRGSDPAFVRLFPEANDGFTPKHLILQSDTKVEYLEARLQVDWASQDGKSVDLNVSGDVWLKVRIGGQEGWVHSEEDFDALGVPQAG